MVDQLAAARALAQARRNRRGTGVMVAVRDPSQGCYLICKLDLSHLFDESLIDGDGGELLALANPVATLNWGGADDMQIAASASGHVIAGADTCGRTIILDAATRSVSSVPVMRHVKRNFPLVPVGDHAFFLIRNYFHTSTPPGRTCELLFLDPSGRWGCAALPDPPGLSPCGQVHGSFAAGASVWVSLGSQGTFSLDTVRRRWRTEGPWELSIDGPSLFVPDFLGSGRNLLFGFPGCGMTLCACDMDASPPVIISSWPETCPDSSRARYDFRPETAELTYFGDGRFCISVNASIRHNEEEDGRPPPRTPRSSIVSFLAVEITSEMKLIKRHFRRYSLPPRSHTTFVI